MKYLNNDYETRQLKDRKKLQEYIDFRKENDEWIFPFCNECSTVGVGYLGEIGEIEHTSIISKKKIEESEEYRLLLVFPKNMKHEIMPIRYTAFPDVCGRAGLKGRTIEMMTDKLNISALDPRIKAQWLSTGLSLNGNTCKILVRDEKISSMKSHEYRIFPEYKLVALLEEHLQSEWRNYFYNFGMVSHEYLFIDYLLNDTDLEENLKWKIQDVTKKTVQTLKVGITMATSDVGNSSVIFNSYVIIDGTKMRMGKTEYVRHDCSNNFETIIKKMNYLAASFNEAEEEIEKLGNILINNPKECFMNIVLAHKLPKKLAEQIASSFEDKCDAIDIYLKLNELIDLHYKTANMSLSSYVNEQETVAKMMYLDYKEYDKF